MPAERKSKSAAGKSKSAARGTSKSAAVPALPWWKTEGVLDGAHMHEPIAFHLRRGGAAADLVERYRVAFSEAGARKVADSGNNFVETCFFKGLGLQAEREEMDRTGRFIEHAHKLGLRVGVYTQWGSIFNETFMLEEPEAADWVQIGVDGKPIEYLDRSNQYFRWRGCPGNRDFLNYLKRVIDLALNHYKADVIYFDNMCLFEYHDTVCYCPQCRTQFRAYLKAKFPTPEAAFARFGIRSFELVEPPPFKPWTEFTDRFFPVRDPMIQEFIDFRCQQLADAWSHIQQYIVSVNPNAGIMGNPSFPRKYNERMTGGVDFWLLRNTPGMYYMENAVRSIGVRDGVVVSNIRGYKYGRALGVTFVPCGWESQPGLAMAEGLAFNDGSGHACRNFKPYLDFFQANRERFYRDVAPAAQVAVLRDDNSLTLRWHEAFTVMEQAQQQLMTSGVPWMPLWRQQLHDGTLDRYQVLVLPGNACVSEQDVQAVTRFVRDGGGLVLCENTGAYNQYHQTLTRWAFAHLFEEGKPSRAGAPGDPFALQFASFWPSFPAKARGTASATFGNGKVVYLPQIRPSADPVATYQQIGGYDSFVHLQSPRQSGKLAAAVDKVAPQPLSARVAGPDTLMVELLRKKDGPLLVHLVNYADAAQRAGAAVVVAAGKTKTAPSARLYLPVEGVDGRALKATRTRAGQWQFRLPGFDRYALLAIDA